MTDGQYIGSGLGSEILFAYKAEHVDGRIVARIPDGGELDRAGVESFVARVSGLDAASRRLIASNLETACEDGGFADLGFSRATAAAILNRIAGWLG